MSLTKIRIEMPEKLLVDLYLVLDALFRSHTRNMPEHINEFYLLMHDFYILPASEVEDVAIGVNIKKIEY